MKKLFWGLMSLLLFACSSDNLMDDNGDKNGNIIPEEKELITLKSGVVVEKWNNSYLYLGDILLSEAQFKRLDETGSMFQEVSIEDIETVKDTGIPVDPSTGLTAYSPESTLRAVGRNPYQNMFWSMLRFTFHKNLTDYQKRSILSAMSYMESVTNVRFYNATGQPDRDPTYGFAYPYVEYTPSTVNNSSVGRIGGKQVLNLYNFDRSTIVHQTCHALGMFHEQCRADRDSYVTVHYNNIAKGNQHNFNKQTKNYYMIGAFDFNSIMLYGSYDFSINGKPTITKKDGSVFYETYELSELDRMFLNRFYLPYIARPDVCSQLDKIVYDGNNKPLTETQRIDLERQLNVNRCSYPLRK